MREAPSKLEPIPPGPGVDAFEALVKKGTWDLETEAALDGLIESHEVELHLLYLFYKESGLVDELPEHERRMYERLATQFE